MLKKYRLFIFPKSFPSQFSHTFDRAKRCLSILGVTFMSGDTARINRRLGYPLENLKTYVFWGLIAEMMSDFESDDSFPVKTGSFPTEKVDTSFEAEYSTYHKVLKPH